MAEARLNALGLAVPERRYTQHEVHGWNPWSDSTLIDKLFLDSPVHQRALYVPPDWYRTSRSLDETNAAWKQGALTLGGQALSDALSRASQSPQAVDWLGVTTVTGYCTPGLDLLLAKEYGLPSNVNRAHFNCIGCHAAVPLLKAAADHVRLRPGTVAATVAVEICSACFTDQPTPENLVALSLFADGAASAVVGSGPGPLLIDFESAFDFEHIDALGFGLTAGGFRIVLDPAIPEYIGQHIGACIERLLGRHGIQHEQVSVWALHPGGSAILDAAGRALDLPASAMVHSRRVLRAFGNMSSPSVLFVLAEALREAPPPPGSFGVLAAFGPGLGIETALIHFDGGPNER